MHGVQGLQDGCAHVKPITIENEGPQVISDLYQLSIQLRRLQPETDTGNVPPGIPVIQTSERGSRCVETLFLFFNY